MRKFLDTLGGRKGHGKPSTSNTSSRATSPMVQPAGLPSRNSTPVNEGKPLEDGDPSVISGALGITLTLVKEVAEEIPFPGVKSAVSGLVALFDMFEVTGDNVAAVKKLKIRVDRLKNSALKPLKSVQKEGGDESSWAPLIEKMRAVTREFEDIIKKGELITHHGAARRFATHKADKGTIEELAERLDDIIDDFKLTLEVERTIAAKAMLEAEKWKLINGIQRANARHDDGAQKGKLEHCYKGTRVAVLDTIEKWIDNPNAPKIFWLCGAAGTGKTTIARTVAEAQDGKKQLGASFFFSSTGEADLSNSKLFFPAIAQQLAQVNPKMLDAIYDTLQKDPGMVGKVMEKQIQALIVQPLAGWEGGPLVLVVDALDECSSETDVKTMLKLWASILEQLPPRFRLFLTSRPEWGIEAEFTSELLAKSHDSIQLHNLKTSVVRNDIKRYLRHQLSLIAKQHGLGTWPTKAEFDALLEKCGELFIVASTIVRFLESSSRFAEKRLQAYLNDTTTSAAYGPIDALYRQVVASVVPEGTLEDEAVQMVSEFRTVAGSLFFLKKEFTARELDVFLKLELGTVNIVLRSLKAVILAPETPTGLLRFVHLSFPEFLIDSTRCTDERFRLNESREHSALALRCLTHMNDYLPPDPLAPEEHGRLESEVAGLEDRLSPDIFRALRYSCVHFASHLESSSAAADPEVVSHIKAICETKLRSFLKYLSNVGDRGSTVPSLRTMLTIYSAIDLPDAHVKASLLTTLADARFEQWYELADLSSAIKHYSEALELYSPGYVDRYLVLCKLAQALVRRHTRHYGSRGDLDAAVERYHEAISLRPPGHHDDITIVQKTIHELAEAFFHRGAYSVGPGSVDDLNTAVEFFQEALDFSPPGQPDRGEVFSDLAEALLKRGGRNGSVDDLNCAIESYREGLDLCPPGHGNRPWILSSLARAFRERNKRDDSVDDLTTTIELYHEALNAGGLWMRDRLLSRLASALVDRYERDGTMDDLNAAIQLRLEDLDQYPPDHALHDVMLRELSLALLERSIRESIREKNKLSK